jgi:hypothetical protein
VETAESLFTPEQIAVWDKYIEAINGARDRLYHRLTAMAKEGCAPAKRDAAWQEHIEAVEAMADQMRREMAEANSAFLAAHKRRN